jgi:hypothetical protein
VQSRLSLDHCEPQALIQGHEMSQLPVILMVDINCITRTLHPPHLSSSSHILNLSSTCSKLSVSFVAQLIYLQQLDGFQWCGEKKICAHAGIHTTTPWLSTLCTLVAIWTHDSNVSSKPQTLKQKQMKAHSRI